MRVGKNETRVDGYEKVTGRTMFTDDLCGDALIAQVKHATIGNGRVVSIDASKALAMDGVVKVITCFDVPDICFGTAGHPWSLEAAHRDVEDRKLLTDRVRYYGDDVCVVVAEDAITAARAVAAIDVVYEEYPVVLDAVEAMKDGAPQLHDAFKNNILGHTAISLGNFDEAIKDSSLIHVEGWYDTPTVQHCHIENPICYAQMEQGRIVVTSSTQIPHIVRRIVAQALGLPWGKVRIVKPYIGGGFGNKQDALYEPLCAFLTTQLGGRRVKIDTTREETFVNTRVRHAICYHLETWVKPDGTPVARRIEGYSNQGGYASHGHGICVNSLDVLMYLYRCEHVECNAYTVFTNRNVGGAMRGYGVPQAIFAGESHADDICKVLSIAPYEWRMQHVMNKGFVHPAFYTENYADNFRMALEEGRKTFGYDEKVRAYASETGPIRRGVGVGMFFYNSGVWPFALESSSCRMILNQDGSLQLQTGETEIGQGCDTVYAQMCADALGVPMEDVHVVSCQDTDVTPYGMGAYASRQTYVGGMAIAKTAKQLREKILNYAERLTRESAQNMDIVDGHIIRKIDGRICMSLGDLATAALYSTSDSQHLGAESTMHVRTNAMSVGACFAEVEVDIPLCKVKLVKILSVHDSGTLINPQLAEAQVHGGMSMGIGFAMSEQLLYDEKSGKVYNNNFLDYKLSTFMDHPSLECVFVQNPEPTHPFGARSLGEPPACPVAPAIRNAVLQATGKAINQIPMTPHVLFEHFRNKEV